MEIVVKLPKVRAQLNQIVDYIADDNPSATFKWLADIESTFDLLSTQPLMGQEVQTKLLGIVRRHAFGKYSIYYQPITGGVDILRVIHSARDQERLV